MGDKFLVLSILVNSSLLLFFGQDERFHVFVPKNLFNIFTIEQSYFISKI